MASMQLLAFTFFAITLLGGVFGVTYEEFQDLPPLVAKAIREMKEAIHELSKVVRDQTSEIVALKAENERQQLEINQKSAVIGRLEELMTREFTSLNEVLQSETAQNSSLEERVSLLEIQVIEIEEDLDDLDQDVNFLFDDQVIQNERIFKLETTSGQVTIELARINEDVEDLATTSVDLDMRVTVLEGNGGGDGNSSVAVLEVRVETLEGTVEDHETRISVTETDVTDLQARTADLDSRVTNIEDNGNQTSSELEMRVETVEGTAADHETRLTAVEENIEGLMMTDIDLDLRITALQENASFQNDTIAFHAVLTSYSSIAGGAPAIFNEVLLNEGDGYDSSTGVFTVPPGKSGLYFFSTYLQISDGEFGRFEMRVNNEDICAAEGDQDNNGSADNTQAASSGVVDLVEGDEVSVVLNASTNTTPILQSTSIYWNGFNGFHI